MYRVHKPVILCGFMACGKTTIGQLLAQELNVPFLDTDEMITAAAGKSIPDIFRDEGEAHFRDLEHDAAKRAALSGPSVVSTGGGMLTFERNGELLQKSGTVILIDRSLDSTVGLLQNDRSRPVAFGRPERELRALYETRMNLYKKYAAAVIANSGSRADCVGKIIRFLRETDA